MIQSLIDSEIFIESVLLSLNAKGLKKNQLLYVVTRQILNFLSWDKNHELIKAKE